MTHQAKKIKILLLENDIQQVDIARKLDVTPANVCQAISGARRSRRVREYIARVLAMPYEEIWPEDKAA